MEAVDSIDYLSDVEQAPGRLALVQRFVNTVDHEHGREVLHSTAKLRTLLVELELINRRTRVTEADLARALALREDLRALALANNNVPVDATLEAELVVRLHATSTAHSRISSGSCTPRWQTARGRG